MILIIGAHKAFALYKAIEEGVNHMWTVSAFQQHPKTLMLCDEDATLELRVKTVKYFKVNFSTNFRLRYSDFAVARNIQYMHLISHLIRLHSKCFITIYYYFAKLDTCTWKIQFNKSGSIFALVHLSLCTNTCGRVCAEFVGCMFFSHFFKIMYYSLSLTHYFDANVLFNVILYWFSGFEWSSS